MSHQPANGPVVIANVYTLLSKDKAPTRIGHEALDLVGMSIYHCGIEIFGQEYSFGLDPAQRPDPTIDGIFVVPPHTPSVGDFKEAVTLGYMPANFTENDLRAVLERLRPTWKAVTYHILNRNCCHFALALATALNPAFDATFPKYVLRAANVGNTVIPAALVDKITQMVAPPTAIPPNLADVIDIPWSQPPPPAPMAAPREPSAVREQNSGGPLKLFGTALLSGARFAAGVVSDLASERDRRSFAQAFPQQNPALLHKATTASIVYLMREWEATLFICTDCIAVSAPPSLKVVIPMTDIVSLQHAQFIPPPAPRLPPTFQGLSGAPVASSGDQHPAFFIYRTTRPGYVVPVFDVRSLGSSVSGAVGKVMGAAPGVNPTLETFDLILRLWRGNY